MRLASLVRKNNKYSDLLSFMEQSTPRKVLPRNSNCRLCRLAVMHLRAVTYLVLSVECEKLAVTKIVPRRFKMDVEFSLMKVIPFRR